MTGGNCISHFSVAVIKFHNQHNGQNEGLVFSFPGRWRSMMVEQRLLAHNVNHRDQRERTQYGMGL